MSTEPSPFLRRLFSAWVFALVLWLPGGAAGEESLVWLALSDRGGIYGEAAAVLAGEMARDARRAELQTLPWQEFQPSPARLPELIVTLGAGAFRGMVERTRKEPTLAGVPILAALLPQASYEAVAPKPPFATSAVFLDQPVERYLDLIRLAMPERRKIGILFGSDSSTLKPALVKAAGIRGMQLVMASVEEESKDIYPALRSVLAEVDVLLALPDRQIFNAGTLQFILIASYNQKIPVVAFSEAYVKAGAALVLHTSPAQAALQTASALRSFLLNRTLPPPRRSTTFSVAFNNPVARSLGLIPGEPDQLAATLRRKEDAR